MNTYEMVSHKKGKIVVLIVLGLSIILSILFGVLYFKELKKRPLVNYPIYTLSTTDWTSDNVTIKIGNTDKISAYSFDGGNNFQDSNEFEVITNGTYEVVVKDTNGRLSKKIIIGIGNIDKEAPIINFENSTSVQLNSRFNLRTGVSVSDDGSGLHGDYTIEPKEIDTSKEGTYQVTYTAFDKVGNYTEKVRTLNVSDIAGKTYYRYRTSTTENYDCEPYSCNCSITNNGSCPSSFELVDGKCCKTCYKACKKVIWGEWSEWSQKKISPSSTVEVETKIE